MPATIGVTNGLKPQNKNLEHVIRTPGRQPSPQPTHLNLGSNSPQRRSVSDEGSGYVAATFEGKERQMEQGQCFSSSDS